MMCGLKHASRLALAVLGLVLLAGSARSRRTAPAQPKGTLTVAIWSGPPATALQDFLIQFRKKYPDVT